MKKGILKKGIFRIIILVIIVTLGVTLLAACAGEGAVGPQGPQGEQGVDGKAGTDGVNGVDGTDGKDGVNGKDGITSLDLPGSLSSNDNIYTTLTYHDLYTLFNSPRVTPGEYIVLIGGVWDLNTARTSGLIEEVAEASGVTEIYLFDPRLDSGLSQYIQPGVSSAVLDIHNYAVSNVSLLAKLEAALSDGSEFKKNDDGKLVTPQLLVIEKEEDKNEAGYPAAADSTNGPLYDKTAESYDRTDTAYTALTGLPHDGQLTKNAFSKREAKILGVYILEDHLSYFKADYTNTGDPVFNATADTYKLKSTLSAFLEETVTSANLERYDVFTVKNQAQASGGGTTRLADNDNADGGKLFVSVTYAELLNVLAAGNERLIYWGGLWCPNSSVYFSAIQKAAIEAGYKGHIYVFDPRLDGASGSTLIRNSSSTNEHARLYAHILDNYLPGYISQWNGNGTHTKPALGLQENGSGSTPWININGKQYTRICVPNIIVYNQNVEGNVVDVFESELTWNGTGTSGNIQSGAGTAYDFRKTSLDNLFVKVGLTDKFTQAEYTVKSVTTGLDGTFTAVKNSSDSFVLTTYYYKTAENALTFADKDRYGATVGYPNSLVNGTGTVKSGTTVLSGANVRYTASGEATVILESSGNVFWQ